MHIVNKVYRQVRQNGLHGQYEHGRFLRVVLLPAFMLNITIYLLVALVFQPPLVLAHAYVIGSDPVDGATVSSPPSVMRIFFNAPLGSLSVAHVFSVQNGDFVALDTRSTISQADSHELDTLLPGGLSQGSYFVRWTAVSNEDGHTTYGTIGFDIGHSSLGLSGEVKLGPTSSNDLGVRNLDFLGVLEVAWEWLVLAALTFWVGILIVEQLVLVYTERVGLFLERARVRSLPLQWLCLAALFTGEIVTLILRSVHLTRALNGRTFDIILLSHLLADTTYGRLWLFRLFLLVVAFLLLWRTNRRHKQLPEQTLQRPTGPLQAQASQQGQLIQQTRITGALSTTTIIKQTNEMANATARVTSTSNTRTMQRNTPLWLFLAGLILCTYALTSNAAQVAQPHISAIVFDGLSRVAQCLWFGSLAYLGYVLLPLLSGVELDADTAILVGFLRQLLPFIVSGVSIQVVSILFLSEATVSTPQQFISDPYGRALLVALIIMVAIILATFYTLFVLCPMLTRQAVLLPVVNAELPARRTRQSALGTNTRRLKQLVSIQTWLGAAVLLCMAFMAFYSPPIIFPNVTYTHSPLSSSTTASTAQTQQVGDLSVSLLVLPGRVNADNTLLITVTNKSGKFITNAEVQVSTNMRDMNMGVAHINARESNSTYVASFDKREAFSMTGVWYVDISIQRPGQNTVQVRFEVTPGG